MASRKLSPEDELEVAARAADGMSCDAIAGWVLKNRGVTITGRGIRKHLAKTRGERTEIAQSVIAEKLAGAVVRDVDVLGEVRGRLEKLELKLFELSYREDAVGVSADHIELHVKVVDRLTKILAMRIAYAGGGGDGRGNAPELPGSAEERAKVLRALAEIEESKR